MTPPVRIALKVGSVLSLLVAIVVVTLPLQLLSQLEIRTVTGLIVVVLAWIAVAAAAVALPLIFIRVDWAARLICLGALAVLPLGLAFSFSKLFCLITACGRLETEPVVTPDGLLMPGTFALALLCLWLSKLK